MRFFRKPAFWKNHNTTKRCECKCNNAKYGFSCVCEHVAKYPGDTEYSCEFCGSYLASRPKCNQCDCEDDNKLGIDPNSVKSSNTDIPGSEMRLFGNIGSVKQMALQRPSFIAVVAEHGPVNAPVYGDAVSNTDGTKGITRIVPDDKMPVADQGKQG